MYGAGAAHHTSTKDMSEEEKNLYKEKNYSYRFGLLLGLAFGAAVSWGVTGIYMTYKNQNDILKTMRQNRTQALENKPYAVSYSLDNSLNQDSRHDRYMLMMGGVHVSTIENKESAFYLGSRVESTFAVDNGRAIIELNEAGTKGLVKFVKNTWHGAELLSGKELENDDMFKKMSENDKKIAIACRDSIPVLKF